MEKNNIKKIFIIGGRSIYKLFFNDAKYLHITNINLLKNDIDEFFPISIDKINNNFTKISTSKLSDEATYSEGFEPLPPFTSTIGVFKSIFP